MHSTLLRVESAISYLQQAMRLMSNASVEVGQYMKDLRRIGKEGLVWDAMQDHICTKGYCGNISIRVALIVATVQKLLPKNRGANSYRLYIL